MKKHDISFVSFTVGNDNYIYDRYSNEFVALDKEKFNDLIEFSNNRSSELPNWLLSTQKEFDILKPFSLPKLSISQKQTTEQKVENKINGKSNQLVFITTENCNMRCKYCIYSESYNAIRKHNTFYNLQWDIAEKALNLFLNASKESSYRYISFYGGEALLNFDIIKKIVSYVETKTIDMHYSISTNLTLMTDEIADFFIEHKIRVTVSLDGPASIHDTYRVSVNDKPTHSIVIKNLWKIREKNESYFKEYISFNTLIVPHNFNLETLDEYFSNSLFGGMPVEAFKPLSLNVEENTFSTDYNYDEFYQEYFQYTFKKFLNAHISGEEDFSNLKISYQIHSGIYKQLHFREMNRLNEYEFYWPNGICILGSRSLFVSPDGSLYPCENLYDYNTLKIGDVNVGVNLSVISSVIDEYADQTIKYCKDCWAYRFCADCFVSTREEATYSHRKKNMFCNNFKRNLLMAFQNYLWILKQNPDAFKYLDEKGKSFIINDMRIDEIIEKG